jgi:hypothetical protein
VQDRHRANAGALTARHASACIERVKCVAAVLLLFALPACTTLVNRRDLYSPEPAPGSREFARQWYGTNTVTHVETEPAPAPQFR